MLKLLGQVAAPLGHGPVLGPANMLTFRSPGLVLSSVLDYKVSSYNLYQLRFL
jgi:hypothetical protein